MNDGPSVRYTVVTAVAGALAVVGFLTHHSVDVRIERDPSDRRTG